MEEIRRGLKRTVIGIEPAMGAHTRHDQTGIIVSGMGVDNKIYVLEDLSGHYTPEGWARCVVHAYYEYEAARVVAETNQGGDLVEPTLRTVDPRLVYKGVRATRGKRERARPIVAFYEAGHVYHARSFPELEHQMCTPHIKSPDRMDARAWAIDDVVAQGHEDPSQPMVWCPEMPSLLSNRRIFDNNEEGKHSYIRTH